MTICIATSNYYPEIGGISTYSQRLAALLCMEGHTVLVLTIDLNSDPIENDETITSDKGLTIVRLKSSFHDHYKYYRSFFRKGSMDAPYWIAMGKAMKEWLQKNSTTYKIDIIEASAFGGFAAFLFGKDIPPVLLSGHGAFFQYKEYNKNKTDEQSKIIVQLEKISFTHSHGIISHSPQSKENILQHTSQPVYLASIPILLKKTNFESTKFDNKNIALVIGSLQSLKGPDVLCKALYDERLINANIRVKWAGTDNYDHTSGRLMSEKLRSDYPEIWNKKFLWIDSPNDEQLGALYREASFIIIPTIWESFNVISVEAAFHHKPVIITNTTGSAYLFTHGKNAWIIPPNDANDLANAILHFSSSPGICETLGEAAFQKIASALTPGKIVKERIGIYYTAITQYNNQQKQTEPDLSFINKYTTYSRKVYFTVRKKLKKLIKNS